MFNHYANTVRTLVTGTSIPLSYLQFGIKPGFHVFIEGKGEGFMFLEGPPKKYLFI